ncbi:CPCC family cysteine-rich protein [Rickettsiales endosymbiont of Stachyamoeba lipophora]|uniref:CPCC family cysteine-rich protein n=1 Tax=Rickettsiales endosymbiont of Stachyamoeba lipophora TaxID=2486578 RepID=UPI000F64E157|nr:CPCC family cysteine-rich protein [Rickettsiales endosymbiont of Stachyamoeba lipophora]AZL16367.1 hydrolase [Rickettsiales endosymbiont of Stachyamoeba lipophora]
MKKYECPCCHNETLNEEPPGTYEICQICKWEDDLAQYYDPDYIEGANKISLNEARKIYQKYSMLTKDENNNYNK